MSHVDEAALEPMQSHIGRLAVGEIPEIAHVRGGIGAELNIGVLRDLVGDENEEPSLDDLHVAVDRLLDPLLAGPHPGVIDVQIERWASDGYERMPVLIKIAILELAGAVPK